MWKPGTAKPNSKDATTTPNSKQQNNNNGITPKNGSSSSKKLSNDLEAQIKGQKKFN